jgi:nitroreductase
MKELREVIRSRRSCRSYSPEPLTRAQVEALIAEAVWAPSGSNNQPWRFVVVQDRERLKRYSDIAKKGYLEAFRQSPAPTAQMKMYESFLNDPNSNIFYNASTLVIIYGDSSSRWHVYDCSMVAQNLMLLAAADGLGSCWIGFAHQVLNSDAMKQELGVPAEYGLVAPIILGHWAQAGPRPEVPRKPFTTAFVDAAQ